MKQRFCHTVISNCTLRDVYEHEKEGWEVCGVNGNTQYPNPTIYFKRPYEENNQEPGK